MRPNGTEAEPETWSALRARVANLESYLAFTSSSRSSIKIITLSSIQDGGIQQGNQPYEGLYLIASPTTTGHIACLQYLALLSTLCRNRYTTTTPSFAMQPTYRSAVQGIISQSHSGVNINTDFSPASRMQHFSIRHVPNSKSPEQQLLRMMQLQVASAGILA